MARSKSSSRWLKEHFSDPFVKSAQQKGYRSRAVYKLLEIQKRDKLLRPGMTVIDLGAAPGGWSQVAAELIGKSGQVIALDILPMQSILGVVFIQGDFREETVMEELLKTLGDKRPEVILSDLAPNLSGENSVDQPRAMYLAELSLELCRKVLNPGGCLLVKVFQGAGYEDFVREMKSMFKEVLVRKPEASRNRSRETYLLGKRYMI